jgi:hypothetical protein
MDEYDSIEAFEAMQALMKSRFADSRHSEEHLKRHQTLLALMAPGTVLEPLLYSEIPSARIEFEPYKIRAEALLKSAMRPYNRKDSLHCGERSASAKNGRAEAGVRAHEPVVGNFQSIAAHCRLPDAKTPPPRAAAASCSDGGVYWDFEVGLWR